MYFDHALIQSRRLRPAPINNGRQRTVTGGKSGRNRQLGRYNTTTALGPVTSLLFLAIIIGVLSLLYLTQVTKTSVYGYQLNELSEQQAALLEQQQELQVETARLHSVARIESSAVTAGLEPETNVTYDR